MTRPELKLRGMKKKIAFLSSPYIFLAPPSPYITEAEQKRSWAAAGYLDRRDLQSRHPRHGGSSTTRMHDDKEKDPTIRLSVGPNGVHNEPRLFLCKSFLGWERFLGRAVLFSVLSLQHSTHRLSAKLREQQNPSSL